MDRRDFLKLGATGALAAGLSGATGCSARHLMSPADRQLIAGLRIVDAHAHPYQTYWHLPLRDTMAPTIEEMEDANVVCCAWAAVPDRQFVRFQWHDSPFKDTCRQLEEAKAFMKSKGVRLVTTAADIQAAVGPGRPPGALLAVEGGDALEGNIDNLNELYDLGVRLMTLVHYTRNDLGDIMTAPPLPGRTNCLYPKKDRREGCLTRFGQAVVAKMIDLGMIIDMAHCDDGTLEAVVEIAKEARVPVVDSHSNPFPRSIPYQRSRQRSWRSMELIAETSGVVCTWPMRYWGKAVPRNASCAFPHRYLWPEVPQQQVDYPPERYWWHDKVRETFDQWALEIKEMMDYLCPAQVGLGTDAGGWLTFVIEGYGGYADLPKLVRAMTRVGLCPSQIEAYLGGNFLRVIKRVLG